MQGEAMEGSRPSEPTMVLRPLKAPAAQRRGRWRLARQGSVHAVITLTAVFARWAIWEDESAEATGVAPVAFVSSNAMSQMVICAVTFIGGFALYFAGGPETPAILSIYFGAQTGMNLFMKNLLSKIVVDEEEGLKGVPIGLLLTAIHQFMGLIFFGFCWFGSRVLSLDFVQVAKIERNEWASVLLFSLAFAANIGLNNFSLSLVAISINMIIRSCLPLSTAILQAFMGKEQKSNLNQKQWVFMLTGVICAGIASWAKSHTNSEESAALSLGVSITVASIFAGAANMVMAGNIKRLSAFDKVCYMSGPAGLALFTASLFTLHPVSQWPNHPDMMTDWQILKEVVSRNPSILGPVGLILLSGVLSFFLQHSAVHCGPQALSHTLHPCRQLQQGCHHCIVSDHGPGDGTCWLLWASVCSCNPGQHRCLHDVQHVQGQVIGEGNRRGSSGSSGSRPFDVLSAFMVSMLGPSW